MRRNKMQPNFRNLSLVLISGNLIELDINCFAHFIYSISYECVLVRKGCF